MATAAAVEMARREARVLEAMRGEGYVSRVWIVEHVEFWRKRGESFLSTRQVERLLMRLRQRGAVEMTGARATARWRVL